MATHGQVVSSQDEGRRLAAGQSGQHSSRVVAKVAGLSSPCRSPGFTLPVIGASSGQHRQARTALVSPKDSTSRLW